MNNSERRLYPFPAITGQDKLKTACLANVVNPRIGGLLISGPKGTGKSTVVRAIGSVLSVRLRPRRPRADVLAMPARAE